MSTKCFTLSDVPVDPSYRMPQFLFEGDCKGLSNDARVLYALLEDRLKLSRKSKLVDSKGALYLIYTREDMCQMLGCSQTTLRKAIQKLKEAGLMDERRQGLTQPNLIYLYYVDK